MVYFPFKSFGILAGIASLATVLAAPAPVTSSNTSEIASRRPSATPHFVVYSDSWAGGLPPTVAEIEGFNVVALSFLLAQGACDQALGWTQLSTAQRASIKSQYAAAGIKLIVSAFGSTDTPTTSGADPIAMADTMASWVLQYDLDGIDVDYEDFGAINAGDGKAEAWLASFTTQLRTHLPQGQYIITHAPVAPWFSPVYPAGAYRKVHETVGDQIDWYNIQFYNQNEYTTCDNLLTASSTTWPESSVFQINSSGGVPLHKLVIGKPASTSGANNGYMSHTLLASCIQEAQAKGWNAGVMAWEFPDASSSWIQSVRSSAFPL
ncbi:hypothetical protein H0H81_003827 [Sphagnurus paluster]|uniref:GH18 domain-containing protein n=1 Tax=Sphagnurus paluster TaxID=117069 RepID=A0A9P7GPE6_9AGAR|nr:hypothetical protein H0H81_003827 [Sphagnurus paluster]